MDAQVRRVWSALWAYTDRRLPGFLYFVVSCWGRITGLDGWDGMGCEHCGRSWGGVVVIPLCVPVYIYYLIGSLTARMGGDNRRIWNRQAVGTF